MSTLAALRRAAATQLAAHSPSPARDAEILLCHVLDREAAWLYAHDDAPVPPGVDAAFAALVARRVAGEPVAYLTGRRGFWTLELAVTADTLIPRPETELLVEFALEKLPAEGTGPVLDLGTGSGAIALAVKAERPQARVLAVDAQQAALAVARANAAALGLAVTFHQGHWFAPVAGERFALVLSNPPYIAADDAHLAQGDVRFEPRSALVAGADGLDDIRHLVATAPAYLLPGGWLALEHGWDQAAAVRALFVAAGFSDVASRRDLGGHERITCGRIAPDETPKQDRHTGAERAE